ncbi:MAG TPA: dTDP-glucose 4,6-dehydratase [Steroidobacteraceae bacterium]|nr:dTDP-glucose 4,6-dehydratase [Steroidobacteraceae bacterium]
MAARLLVTGGAGFIGANFVHHWLGAHPGERLVVLDALTYSGNLANLQDLLVRPELRVVHGTICDTALVESLLREEGLDTIVHFAAESHVDRSISGPEVFIQTNVVGTHSLLQAARQVWLEERTVPVHRFHHISTDEVFGSLEMHDAPFTETTRYAPNSPYAASKAASDHLVRAYQRTFGLCTTLSNCSNNYGPYQFPEKLIPLVIVNLLQGRKLPIYGDGLNVRDWLHVDDHCRGIEAILLHGVSGATYNLGGRAECNNLQLVKDLCSIADRLFRDEPALAATYPDCPAGRGVPTASLIGFVADRLGHDRRYATDCTLVERQLGFLPRVSLANGLEQTFRWYLEHGPWWQAILEGRHPRRLPAAAAA